MELHTARPSFMFQEAALLPVADRAAQRRAAAAARGRGPPGAPQRAEELLALVRLDGQGGKRPHELSGGMRQRVSLARALAATTRRRGRGPLLLMDEPFAALDAITRDVLQGELLRVWQTTGTHVLFVTHDVREAVRLAQRVVLLSSRPGTVVARVDGSATGRSEAPARGDHRTPATGDHEPCRMTDR